MNFSELQQKEMIDARSGELLGFIEDAEITLDNGKIEYFIVSSPKKFYQFLQGEKKTIKVYIDDIFSIGKDVIIVYKK
ncbi:MAG: YlmC/YmxH family sporulation protein [Lysinibacillus sp.]